MIFTLHFQLIKHSVLLYGVIIPRSCRWHIDLNGGINEPFSVPLISPLVRYIPWAVESVGIVVVPDAGPRAANIICNDPFQVEDGLTRVGVWRQPLSIVRLEHRNLVIPNCTIRPEATKSCALMVSSPTKR